MKTEDRIQHREQIGDILDMSIPAISQHLRKLRDAGVVKTTRAGQVIYALNDSFREILAPNFDLITKNRLLEVVAT